MPSFFLKSLANIFSSYTVKLRIWNFLTHPFGRTMGPHYYLVKTSQFGWILKLCSNALNWCSDDWKASTWINMEIKRFSCNSSSRNGHFNNHFIYVLCILFNLFSQRSLFFLWHCSVMLTIVNMALCSVSSLFFFAWPSISFTHFSAWKTCLSSS